MCVFIGKLSKKNLSGHVVDGLRVFDFWSEDSSLRKVFGRSATKWPQIPRGKGARDPKATGTRGCRRSTLAQNAARLSFCDQAQLAWIRRNAVSPF